MPPIPETPRRGDEHRPSPTGLPDASHRARVDLLGSGFALVCPALVVAAVAFLLYRPAANVIAPLCAALALAGLALIAAGWRTGRKRPAAVRPAGPCAPAVSGRAQADGGLTPDGYSLALAEGLRGSVAWVAGRDRAGREEGVRQVVWLSDERLRRRADVRRHGRTRLR